jgi:hypothetical protein
MFWFSYEVSPLPGAHADAFGPEFWRDVFEVEEAVSGVRIAGVFAGKIQPQGPGDRVWLRGFRPYSLGPGETPSWSDRLLAWFRRKPR